MYLYLIYQPTTPLTSTRQSFDHLYLTHTILLQIWNPFEGFFQVEIRILHSTFLFYLWSRISGKLTIIFSETPFDLYLDTNGKVKEILVQSTHVYVNPSRNGSLSVDQLPFLSGSHFGQDYPSKRHYFSVENTVPVFRH